MLEIMKSYLSDRKQSLRYGAERTSPRTVTFDVSQGSVLGPLLIIIYVNDIRHQCNCSTITLYADDTALQPQNDANEILFKHDNDNIDLYLSDKKLTLNVETTINLNLGVKYMMNDLRLINASLKNSEVKYLGVLLDNKLDFKKYINCFSAKLTKFTELFYKLKFLLSIRQLVLLYKTFVQPVIQLVSTYLRNCKPEKPEVYRT